MKRVVTTLGLLLCVVGAGGCAPHEGYGVEWLYAEQVGERLDAQWYLRDIRDTKGLHSVELVYCPMVPRQPTVCRTSVVWQRDARALLDHPNVR